MVKKIKLIIIVIFSPLISCLNNGIDDTCIYLPLEYICENEKQGFTYKVDSIDFYISHDTLRCNIPLNFKNAFKKIDTSFSYINQLKLNKAGKDYLKACILADFVYAAFSSRFLGDNFRIETDLAAKKNWEKYSLQQKYLLSNSNQISTDCEMRTIVYQQLIDSLLQLKTKKVSIDNMHTFPLVFIERKAYLIDPSEPLIFMETNRDIVLTYNEILPQINTLRVKQSRRSFGATHLLISKTFYDNYNSTVPFKTNLLLYLYKHESMFEQQIPNCYSPVFIKSLQVLPLKETSKNKWAIKYQYKDFGSTISASTIKRNYFGIFCN